MSDNKKKKPSVGHATMSFSQSVAKEQVRRAQENILPVIRQEIAGAFQQMGASLYQVIISERAQTQVRQMAYERVLKQNCPWFTDDLLAMTIADVEDESLKLEAVTDEIQPGDKVRIDFQSKAPGQEAYGVIEKVCIHSLLAKGQGDQVQTLPDLERTLVGRKVGEETTLAIPQEVPGKEGEPENTYLKVTVRKVSRKKETTANVPANGQ